ncbi:GIDE domain-containing protein [Solicola gregarius]|uniref:RING-type E3 ubiquitin transferase n=1 Tax=Solicola gregarius TaxID=2908642 RepID=A0AA46YNJ5_9ACTN|nr:GIDE domain-containing protein [Solicola gregarius]UYM07541.1 E3 ubiquitin ligase family protein [Solicola gregarius]
MGLIIVGVVVILFAALPAFMIVLERRSIQRMTVTDTATAAELTALARAAVAAGGGGSFNHPAEVKGVVRFGPGGPLTSQLTDTRCVWFRHKVEREFTERRGERTRRKTETLTSSRSDEPFYVEDATGTVLVRPTVNIEKARKVIDEFREPGPADGFAADNGVLPMLGGLLLGAGARTGTIGFRSREWVLEEGSRVYVLGEATDVDGEVVIGEPSDAQPLVISTRSESELSREHGRKGVVHILVGLACVAAGVTLVVLGATG